jgi:hypothetical protein
MAARNSTSSSIVRLADRLELARRGRFVGRSAELELFHTALKAAEAPYAVLYIHGPGGIGKTTLLREYARIAAACGRPVIALDGREIDPTPAGFLLALSQSLGLQRVDFDAIIASWPPSGVLLIDRYELLTALDSWLRETFLPELPAQSLVVMASRPPPASPWRADIDWADLTRVLPLRDLLPDESQRYLSARGIPDDQHAAILAFTHGHPLALTLVADVLSRDGAPHTLSAGAHSVHSAYTPLFEPEPDVVRALLERLTQDAPSAAHRLALDICVRMWATTEALLADMLARQDDADAHAIFEWLSQLSFIEQGPFGLFPHDLAREALDADWRWRNPEGFRQLTYQLFEHLYSKFQQARGMEQQRIWFYLLYLCRHSPAYRPYYAWSALGSAYAEVASSHDHPAILDMVARHQHGNSLQIAAHWLRRQPQAFRVFRNVGGEILGFLAQLRLGHPTPEDIVADPAMQVMVDFIAQRSPLRQDEEILVARFWMNSEGNVEIPSPGLNLCAINCSIDYTTTPKLAWSFIAMPQPEIIEPHLNAAHLWRSPDADFVVDGYRYGVFAHDWRVEPPVAWLHVKASLAADPNLTLLAPDSMHAPALLVLSRPDFADAVRQALRDYTHPAALATNPLMRSRLVADVAEDGAASAPLQALLREAVASLTANPKDLKLHRALWRTYIEPAPTQERAAEWLSLPFNTYRYHLTSGLNRVTNWLWQREINSQ